MRNQIGCVFCVCKDCGFYSKGMGTSRGFEQMHDVTVVFYIYIYIYIGMIYIKYAGLLIRLCLVLVVAHRIFVVGAGYLVVVWWGLVALRHMGSQFPNQGSNSCPLYWKVDSFPF